MRSKPESLSMLQKSYVNYKSIMKDEVGVHVIVFTVIRDYCFMEFALKFLSEVKHWI